MVMGMVKVMVIQKVNNQLLSGLVHFLYQNLYQQGIQQLRNKLELLEMVFC
jgi:hypothetical protein